MLNIIKTSLKINTYDNIKSYVPWEKNIKYNGIIIERDKIKKDNFFVIEKASIGITSPLAIDTEGIFSNKYNIKFKLNTENIEKIIITYDFKTKIINDTNKVDYLFSFNINIETEFKIIIPYMSSKSKVKIYDIEIIKLYEDYPVNYDKIYIINLERRTDRKEQIIKQLKKYKITNYEIINAVDGKNIIIQELFNKLKNKTKINTPGHLGCLLSHKKVLLKALEDNVKSFMILEDDIIFKDNFLEKIKTLKLPEWECIYLGAPLEQKKIFLNNWVKHKKFSTTHGMIIKSSIIDYLLKILENNDNYIDVIYSYTLQKYKKTYLLNDIVLTENESTDTSSKNKKFLYMINNFYKDID